MSAAGEQGAFVLGARLEGVADIVNELNRIEQNAERVAKVLRSLGAAKGTAAKLGIAQQYENELGEIANLNKKMNSMFNTLGRGAKNFNQAVSQTTQKVKTATNEVNKLGNEGKNSIDKTTKGTKDFNSMMGIAIGKIIRYRVAFGLWRQITDLMRGAVQVTIEMNQTLTNLRKVMDPVTSDFNFLAQSAFDLGDRFAASALRVAESMRIWAQQGKTMVEVVKLTEATLLGVNAANLTAMESVEALTSATKAFNIEASQAPEIIDKWMAVQARHAVTAQDLANGTKAIGAAARSAGLDMDELNGVIAAIGSVTRKTGREVANSFKTMLARIQRPTAIRTFQRLGIAVMKSQDEIREIPRVLEDLSLQWDGLENAVKQNIAVTVGGIRRYTDFIVLMDNFQEYLEATRNSFNALGEAQVASQEQVGSYAGQLQQLKTAAEELGYTLGESGVLQVITNLAKSFTNLVGTLKQFMPVLGLLGKYFGFLLAMLTPIYASMLAFKGVVLLLGKVMLGSLLGGLAAATTKVAGLSAWFMKASASAATFSASIGGIAGGIGIVVGVIGALLATTGLLDTFFGKVDKAVQSFAEFSDQTVAATSKLVRIRDEYRQSVKDVQLLIDAKDKLKEEYADTNKAMSEEEYIIQNLVKRFPNLIKKYSEFATLTPDAPSFDFSDQTLDAALKVYESKLGRAEEITRESLQKAIDTHKDKFKVLNKVGEDFRDKRKALADEIAAISLIEVSVRTGIEPGPSSKVTISTEFKDYVSDLKNRFLSELEKAGVDDAVRVAFETDVNNAFSKISLDAVIDRAEFVESISDAFKSAHDNVYALGESTNQTILSLTRTLNEHEKAVKDISHEYFMFKDRSTALVAALEAARRETNLFERDNKSIANALHGAGIAFNDVANRAEHYQKKLKELYDTRTKHELEIAALEAEIAHKKTNELIADQLNLLHDRLETLRNERDAVSSYLDAYDNKLSGISDRYNDLIKAQQDVLLASKPQSEEYKNALNAMGKLKEARQKEKEELVSQYASLKGISGAYQEILDEIIKTKKELSIVTDEQVAQLWLFSNIEKSYRQNTIYAEILGKVAKARGQDERAIIDVQLQELAIAEQLIQTELKKNKWIYGEYDLQKKLIGIAVQREKLEAQRKTEIPELIKVSQLRKNINLETAKYNALADRILASTAIQERNQFDMLKLEEELAINRAQYNEEVLKTAGIDQDSEKVLERQASLMQEIQSIQFKILDARIAINKEYQETVRQTSQDISAGISGPLGDMISIQIDKYERLKEIQQDIILAEKDKTKAIQEGNQEGLAAANEKLKELTKEQNKLNDAAYQWKEALKSIARNLIELSQKRYAEQIVDSLMSISKDGPTIGEKIAEGIEIKPEIVDFTITEKLTNALKLAGDDISVNMFNSLAKGAELLKSSVNMREFKEIEVDPSGVKAALDGSFSLGSESIYTSMTMGGVDAGRSIYNSMMAAASGKDFGSVSVNTEDATKDVTSAISSGTSEALANAADPFVTKIATILEEGGDNMRDKLKEALEEGSKDVKVAGLTSGEIMASKLKVAMQAAAALLGQQIGVSLGTQAGGGGQWAGTGSQLGAMFGSTLGSTYGAAGSFVGGALGGALGGLLGGFFDDDAVDRQESLLTRIEENTAVLKDLDTRIFNAPTDFKLPALATRGGNIQAYNQITINVNGAGDSRSVANEVVDALRGVSNYNTIAGGI